MSGSIQSISTRSGRRSAMLARAALDVRRFAHVEAAAAQSECNHFADRPLVLDDQNLLGGHRDSNLTAGSSCSITATDYYSRMKLSGAIAGADVTAA